MEILWKRSYDTDMKVLRLLRFTGLVVVVLAIGDRSFGADRTPFFAMDTALRDGKSRSAAEQAALLKGLGYDGIGTSGYPSEEFLAAFEKAGLRVFNTYLTLNFDSAKPGLEPMLKDFVPRLKGHGTALWIAINGVTRDGETLKPSSPLGDAVVVPLMRELADLAQTNGVKIALYPHARLWIERVEDALRVASKVDRPNVGVTFNLCHWLKVEGSRDPKPVLAEAMPRLFFVSINGADSGDTRAMPWDRLIQPLDSGTYDVGALLKSLRELGYEGPIGFQGYGIPSDSGDILRHTMAGWRRITAR
jgi:sugar phosphate isomerase/epimerase